MLPETKAERIAREDRDWRAEKLAADIETRRLVLTQRIGTIDGRLDGLRPLRDALVTLGDRFSARLADLDAAGPPVSAAERDNRRRSREDLRELLRQIQQGAGPMAEGDLAAQLSALGVAQHDGRPLPMVERQVATLVAERAGLQAQIDAM